MADEKKNKIELQDRSPVYSNKYFDVLVGTLDSGPFAYFVRNKDTLVFEYQTQQLIDAKSVAEGMKDALDNFGNKVTPVSRFEIQKKSN